MTDMELAEEIERRRGGTDMLNSVLMPHQWEQIIAALRRAPDFDKLHLQLTEIRATLDAIETQHDERPPSGEMVMVPREPYWMIERGSPAEWWVRGMPEVWTTDASKAQRFNEWGAKTHAKELEAWGVKGPLRATEHLDCDGPLPAAEAEGRKS